VNYQTGDYKFRPCHRRSTVIAIKQYNYTRTCTVVNRAVYLGSGREKTHARVLFNSFLWCVLWLNDTYPTTKVSEGTNRNMRDRNTLVALYTPTVRATMHNVRIYLSFISRNYSHRPAFLPLIVWLLLPSLLMCSVKRLFLQECVSAVQGHLNDLRSILIPIENAYATSY